MAAVLAAGDGAVLSHRDAAAVHALGVASHGPIHVTAPRQMRSGPKLRLHHRGLSPDEVTSVDGIPATTVARTIFDLAATEPRRRVERAIHEAEVQRTLDLDELEAIVSRSPHTRGVRPIRSILAERDFGSVNTKEQLEERFIALLEEEGLPLPETNRWMQIGDVWIEADCVWPDQRLIAELDSWGVHGTRRRFETDRERDRALHVASWRPIRLTWRHVHHGRSALVADLHGLLDPRGRRAKS